MTARDPSKQIVLVVEDEPLIRMMAAVMIEDAGFEVMEAGDAVEAVEILESRPDIRLVFTDVDMPNGMDGIRLAACISDRWPPIEIIVTSGKPIPKGATLPPRSVFFPKPYREEKIIATLKQMAA